MQISCQSLILYKKRRLRTFIITDVSYVPYYNTRLGIPLSMLMKLSHLEATRLMPLSETFTKNFTIEISNQKKGSNPRDAINIFSLK